MKKSPKHHQVKTDGDTTSIGSDNVENEKEIDNASRKKSKLQKQNTLRHFSNIENEPVLKRYNCALASDFLRQGTLYVTENYFAFYSNILGYVTKLLIPIPSVQAITKEKTAKFIPNAIGIITGEQKHIFASFLQREATYELLLKNWENVKSRDVDISDFNSDSEESNYQEEEVYDVDEIVGKDSSQPPEIGKNNVIKRKINIKNKVYNILWYAAIFGIFVLFITSGILFYQIRLIGQSQSTIATSRGNFKRVSRSFTSIFQNNPDLLSKSYLSINDFVDKNIGKVSSVRKSLETLSRILENGPSSLKSESSSHNQVS